MATECDTRILLERVITTQEVHGRELCMVRADVKALGIRVAEHRIGWRVNIWVGSACLVLGAAIIGYWRT